MKTLVAALAIAAVAGLGGCVVHAHGRPGHFHGPSLVIPAGHVHDHHCGHYHHNGAWYRHHDQGHIHRHGCGHTLRGGIWIHVD